MPSTTASNPHVEALWWLLTVGGGHKSIQQPGDLHSIKAHGPVKATVYEIMLADSATNTTRTIRAKTRPELLDKLVALMVSEKLS